MALQLSLTGLQQDNCSEWVLTDSTGVYAASGNPDGWAIASALGGNLVIDNGAVTYAELTIAFPSEGSVTIDIIDNWADLTGLSNTAFDAGTDPSALTFTLTPELMGLASITDGVYTVTYKVGDGTTYANSTLKSSISYTFALYCNIECCIEQRLAQVPDYYNCETCSNDFLNTTTILWTLLQALKMSACSASVSKFNTILTTLQDACEVAGCDCS